MILDKISGVTSQPEAWNWWWWCTQERLLFITTVTGSKIKDFFFFTVIEYNLLGGGENIFQNQIRCSSSSCDFETDFYFLILSLNGHLSNCSYWKHWAALELKSVSPYQGGELLYVNQQGGMDYMECSRHRVLTEILKYRNIASSPEVKQQHECALKSRFRQHFDLSLYSLWPLAFSFHGPDNISSHTSTSHLFIYFFFTTAPLYPLHPSPPPPGVNHICARQRNPSFLGEEIRREHRQLDLNKDHLPCGARP